MSSSPPYHSGDLRKGRHSEPRGLYYITKNLLDRGIFDEQQRTECCASLQEFRRRDALYLHAFVIMPDHYHSLLSLGDRYPLEKALHELSRHMSYPTRQRAKKIPWQEGFHDHKVRAGDSVVDIVRYIEQNPVEAGLVETADLWPWSSAHPDFREKLDRSFLGRERWE
jgi:REP element-mobilizing transposase RayT